MKKLKQLAVWILAASLCGLAMTGALAGQASPSSSAQGPTIKDPAEYNAYISAIGMGSPAQKAQALEQFLQQYPNSVIKNTAIEVLLNAYQQAGNTQKMMDTASRLVQVEPSNVTGLFVMAYGTLGCAQTEAQCANNALQYAQRGLQALPAFAKPSGMSDQQFDQTKMAMANTFNIAGGYGALQQKNYTLEEQYLLAAYKNSPNEFSIVYPLATAYLSQKPLSPLGFWYGARAINLSQSNPQIPADQKTQIANYVQKNYEYYHGGDDGWQDIMKAAAASPDPPAGFQVTQMTPAVQAANMLKAQPDPTKMGFGEWEFILQNGDQPTVDAVWTAIKGKPLQYEAKLISATTDKLVLATTDDAIQSSTADADVALDKPVTGHALPKTGEMLKVRSTPESYDKDPYMLHMDTGVFVPVAKPAPAHRRPAAHRKARPQ